jgi:hypothetical protein
MPVLPEVEQSNGKAAESLLADAASQPPLRGDSELAAQRIGAKGEKQGLPVQDDFIVFA